jgi:hypothetical protein
MDQPPWRTIELIYVTKHSQKENDIRFDFIGHNDVGTIVIENCSYINQNTFGSLHYSYNTYLQVHYWKCS